MLYIKNYENFGIDWDFDEEEIEPNSWVTVKDANELKIGDIIKCDNISDDNDMIGKVIGFDTYICVEFEKNINGHDCGGKGKYGHCWFFSTDNVVSRMDMVWYNIRKKVGITESVNFDDWDEEEFNEEDSLLTNKEFVKFLKDNNVYDKFIYNLKNYISLDDYCYKIYITNYILDSFTWNNTKEGHNFWYDIYNKWVNYLNNLNESIDFEWDEEEFDEEDSPLTNKEFVKYLKDNNIHEEFIYNCEHYNKNLINNINKTKPHDYVNVSFIWSYTKEGYDFWYDIYNKWRKYLKKQNESIDFDDWDEEEFDNIKVGDLIKPIKENNYYYYYKNIGNISPRKYKVRSHKNNYTVSKIINDEYFQIEYKRTDVYYKLSEWEKIQ